jgi:mRNA interferase MazF
VIARGDVWDADMGDHGARPCVVVTRETAIPVLSRVTVVAVTSRLRGHVAEVELDGRHGVSSPSAANCDLLATVAKDRLTRRRGSLDPETLRRLDDALRVALGLDLTS